MKLERFTCSFLLLTGSFVAFAQESGAYYYVPVAQMPQPGKAPAMQVKLLTPAGQEPREYAVIFGKGDEVASGLVDFAERYHVTSAHFTAIGALHDVTVAWMDPQKKSYKAMPINQQVEVLSLVGDVAVFNGKPAVHTHLVVGFEDASAKGGHLIEAHVFPTLEVMVTVDPVMLQKSFDPETGLALIDPRAQ